MQRLRCHRGGAEIQNGSLNHMSGLQDSSASHSRRTRQWSRDLAMDEHLVSSGAEISKAGL
jgi:hypothetical protein